MEFVIDLERMIFNFIWENEESRIAKTVIYNERTSNRREESVGNTALTKERK